MFGFQGSFALVVVLIASLGLASPISTDGAGITVVSTGNVTSGQDRLANVAGTTNFTDINLVAANDSNLADLDGLGEVCATAVNGSDNERPTRASFHLIDDYMITYQANRRCSFSNVQLFPHFQAHILSIIVQYQNSAGDSDSAPLPPILRRYNWIRMRFAFEHDRSDIPLSYGLAKAWVQTLTAYSQQMLSQYGRIYTAGMTVRPVNAPIYAAHYSGYIGQGQGTLGANETETA